MSRLAAVSCWRQDTGHQGGQRQQGRQQVQDSAGSRHGNLSPTAACFSARRICYSGGLRPSTQHRMPLGHSNCTQSRRYHSHLCSTGTSVPQTPLFHSHLCTTVTSVPQSPLHHGHHPMDDVAHREEPRLRVTSVVGRLAVWTGRPVGKQRHIPRGSGRPGAEPLPGTRALSHCASEFRWLCTI